MKVYQDRVVPEHTVKDVIRRTCDLCGHDSKDCGWKDPKWDDSETEVSINARRAMYYGGEGESVSYEIDLCPKCFWERLIPWLKTQGANIEEKEFSW